MKWVVIFFIALFGLMTWSEEAERDTTVVSLTEGMNFEDGMVVIDSLWDVIQAFNLLEENYYILDKRKWESLTIEMLEYGKKGYIEK